MNVNKKLVTAVPFFTLTREYKKYKKEIDSAISSVVTSQQFILGKESDLFENEFAQFLKAKYVIGVASGTDGLFLSLKALGIGKGDEVLVQANTFIASIAAILYAGAKPVLCDVEERTCQLDASLLQKYITKKTKAIIPVHLYGASCDMDKLMIFAKKNNLFVIEDACQAHGSTWNRKSLGTFGDTGVFSFYPSKNLGAYGDAGAVVTNNKNMYDAIIKLRNHGQTKKYYHDIVGYNSRLDEVQAAVLRVKLSHLREQNKLRRDSVALYLSLLEKYDLQEVNEKNISVYHLFVMKTEKRDALQKFLETKQIHTMIHYPVPVHLQKALSFLGYKKGDFPITENLAKSSLSLPLFPFITKDEIVYTTSQIEYFFDV